MVALKFVPLAALLLGLIVLVSCQSDEDEKRPNRPSGTAQSANQSQEKNLTPTKGKRVKKVHRLLLLLQGELEAIAQKGQGLPEDVRDTIGSALEETHRLAKIVESLL